MEGSRVLQGESLREFREGICLVLNNWWAIRLFVKKGWGGPNTTLLVDQLADRVLSRVTQSKRPLTEFALETLLNNGVTSLGVMVDAFDDNSCAEVAEQLMVMHEECLQGDFSSVKILIEANLSQARAMLQRGHLSEMEGSRVLQGESMKVFKEGIDLVMQSLWATQVFVERECGDSKSHQLVQQLAHLILFWFTQTQKPLSSASFERILRNEMFSLSLQFDAIDSIKEIAEKLMVMHKECLQGNFSSVEVLREANLRQAAQPPCVMQQQTNESCKLFVRDDELEDNVAPLSFKASVRCNCSGMVKEFAKEFAKEHAKEFAKEFAKECVSKKVEKLKKKVICERTRVNWVVVAFLVSFHVFFSLFYTNLLQCKGFGWK